MKHQRALQQLLQKRFDEVRGRNPSYSLRAFARSLDTSAAMTSRILAGKRQVSLNLARRILDALMLDPRERAELLEGFTTGKTSAPVSSLPQGEVIDPTYLQLTADQFRVIADWQCFALLSLFKTKDFRSDPQWMAERLGLTRTKVEEALERLLRLELISKNKGGRFSRSTSMFKTTDEVHSLSLRRSHFENLDLAKRSLENDSLEDRDFTHLTLAFNRARMKEAKKAIRKFQDRFDAVFEGDEADPTDVYRMSVQFFPMTRTPR